ncbi:MAG: divalent-cation tolerance protein CutA [Deltaproteobacteria bacterium]|nr:divalent-cation tolerance protein CutA [Deltaproteobacteria bacterium]
MKLVLSTIPPNDAAEMAHTLVTEKHVACVNIIPMVRSIYTWKGELCDDAESMMVMKTTDDKIAGLIDRIRQLHSYDVPEIVALNIDENGSNPDYLKWVLASVGA